MKIWFSSRFWKKNDLIMLHLLVFWIVRNKENEHADFMIANRNEKK